MNKYNPDKVQKRTLELCKELAEKEEYLTAPLTIYERIRSLFTTNISIMEVSNTYPQELVELVHAEVFNKKEK